MKAIPLFFALALLAPNSGAQHAARPTRAAARLQPALVHVAQGRLVDPAGKPLRIQGINVVDKSQSAGYTGDIDESVFKSIHSWGMNTVRLAIFWDGLEPEPGVLDKKYLERIAGLVAKAKAHGLYVLLDMHQDLYSIKFADGAPLWATIDEGKQHIQTEDWNDSYYASPAVQTALDHFWQNSPAPDGTGLQDHYARVWQFVADRFKDEPAVLGFDLMNEPFPGADAGKLEYVMLARVAELLAQRPGEEHPTVEELLRMEGEAKGRRKIFNWLGDMDIYRGMLEAGTPLMQAFDRDSVMPLYGRVRAAIRAVDKQHLLFLEASMSANMGVETGIAPLVDEAGRRDPGQVYSPHIYDIVVDTDLFALTSDARIDLIVAHHSAFARKYNLPVVVGEWGAYYMNPAAADAARKMKQRFAQAGFGDLFWAYRREITNWKGLDALKVTPQ